MKTTVDFYQFRATMENMRPDNFTRDGLVALFDYFEEYEQMQGEEIELDPIAICCDFTQWESFEEFSASYPDIAKDEIDEHGLFIDVDGESFITSNF